MRTGNSWKFKLPSTIFDHPDDLDFDVYIYEIPDWVSYDNDTTTFSGKTTEDDVGTYTIFVVAVDTLDAKTSDSFDVNVVKNFLPVVNNQVPEQ